ncbi:RNase H domain-containing protein [Trichonephila clavipes]|uniref:RNase H domain-containing protein n=1 Tax=Trichonephila clavipes TaxID=2585209 RepID=A0A8X6RYT8_TRICX|nr:RNase H domain-containing protein [Trichonephila clavipes]
MPENKEIGVQETTNVDTKRVFGLKWRPIMISKDGSSDETFLNGGSRNRLQVSSFSVTQKQLLQAILNGGSWIIEEICFRLFKLQELDKVYFLQWLPAHIDITGIENADKLTKEARNLNNDNFVNVTLLDANAVTKFKLKEKSIPVKHQIFNISGDRLITKTIARLRTGHHRGMKFDRDG